MTEAEQPENAPWPGHEDDGDSDSGAMTCWCGATGSYNELFDDSGLDARCGGLGVLNCHCGGDLCVCHYHGERDCFGCKDCEGDEDY